MTADGHYVCVVSSARGLTFGLSVLVAAKSNSHKTGTGKAVCVCFVAQVVQVGDLRWPPSHLQHWTGPLSS